MTKPLLLCITSDVYSVYSVYCVLCIFCVFCIVYCIFCILYIVYIVYIMRHNIHNFLFCVPLDYLNYVYWQYYCTSLFSLLRARFTPLVGWFGEGENIMLPFGQTHPPLRNVNISLWKFPNTFTEKSQKITENF